MVGLGIGFLPSAAFFIRFSPDPSSAGTFELDDFSELLKIRGICYLGGLDFQLVSDTVDGSEFLHQLRLVGYPIIYRVSYIPGGWPWDF